MDAQASRGALSNEERIRFGVTAGPSPRVGAAAEAVEDDAALAEAVAEAATAEAAAEAAIGRLLKVGILCDF